MRSDYCSLWLLFYIFTEKNPSKTSYLSTAVNTFPLPGRPKCFKATFSNPKIIFGGSSTKFFQVFLFVCLEFFYVNSIAKLILLQCTHCYHLTATSLKHFISRSLNVKVEICRGHTNAKPGSLKPSVNDYIHLQNYLV